jgi:hypothetical protein
VSILYAHAIIHKIGRLVTLFQITPSKASINKHTTKQSYHIRGTNHTKLPVRLSAVLNRAVTVSKISIATLVQAV